MVGGHVEEVLVLEGSVWIGARNSDEAAGIMVERSWAAECIHEGDHVWWRGEMAYWTPPGKSFEHFPLNRVGVGMFERPKPEEVVKAFA